MLILLKKYVSTNCQNVIIHFLTKMYSGRAKKIFLKIERTFALRMA